MNARTRSFDVVVIGGGLSGMMAALAARRQGAEVAILTEGNGVLELSSGSIDLLGALPSGGPVTAPYEAFGGLAADHPYVLLGAGAVRDGVSAFLAAMPGYAAPPDLRNQQIVTAVGSLRATYLTAPGAAVLPPAGSIVTVVGFRGLAEFHPGVVAAGLRQAAPDLDCRVAWIDLPPGPNLHPLQLARLMEETAFREQVIAHLAELDLGGLVLLPAVLGLDGAAAVRSSVVTALGVPVGEVPLLSPSLPGVRLASGLLRAVQRAGVEYCPGVRAVGARAVGGRVSALVGRTAAGSGEYRAGAFVLAAGGLLGCGLEVRDRTVAEPVFGLPVEAPEGAWAGDRLLPVGGHPFVRAGIRTDARLRPAGWENLYICGKMLAGYDPYQEGCGGGVAIASGWRAGLQAGGAQD